MKYILAIIIVITSSNLYSEVIYKTIPGTPFKDITEPVMVIDKNIIYKPIPGTNMKDVTEPLMIIDKVGIYPTIPGTTLPDYAVTPQFVIE